MIKFKEINDGLTCVTGLTSELESLYINDVYNKKDSNVLVVTSSIYEANKLYDSLINYNKNVYLYQMDDFIASESAISSPELMINRIETLNSIVFDNTKKIVITNLMGLLRFLPTLDNYKNSLINIEKNMDIDKDELYKKLCINGYNTSSLVTKTGEISNRGYILDIFPVNEDNAIRIEFFGDTIDSIRYFDVNTQLSYKEIDKVSIYPFTEFIVDQLIDDEDRKQKFLPKYGNISKLNDYLDSPILVYKDYNDIKASNAVLESEIVSYKENNNNCDKFMYSLGEFHEECEIYILSVDNMLPSIKVDDTHNYTSYTPLNYNDDFDKLNEDLKMYLNTSKTIIICLNNEHTINNISKYINYKVHKTTFDNITTKAINVVKSNIASGYIYEDYVVLSESNLFKTSEKVSNYRSKFKYGTKISKIESLSVGDYVVHNTHGIGRYLGIIALKKGDLVKDYLQIQYKDDDKLYIPVEKIDLISKYSSNEDIVPRLNKLGGTEWHKTKMRIKGRLKYIADELLKIAAERKLKKGFAFAKDNEMMALFESEFGYEETVDQKNAIKRIKEAMEKSTPMDMILCGDVGYGKTEVAFRAIFKAVCSNKQVAYLCPTTILSNQQYTSALSRFKNFPVNMALLNRFTTKKEVENIIKGLKNGSIDVVFGTHRLLSDDISYKDLGLLIVDEEQRFGVAHKEKIKKYKSNIDVLTLSATPIPRTLQMSMVGIRDLTLIETPPKNRYPVQTYVLEESVHIIKDAIYKELSRNGQVYILCNKIESFDEKIREITRLIPDIKIGYAHGKMSKNEIEDIMYKFINNEFNVLLCTTIIETGIDIPNANTLIILDADKFGLSQLYQIRGRVGRTDRIAYAYLMYGKNKALSEVATKRLSAIKEFATLGSGLSIAKRDLSIRGAGDVLGSEQSGFIDSIGIELYLKMLNEEVNKLKGIDVEEVSELPLISVGTHISDEYVSDDKLKIEIHKKINEINSYESLLRVKSEIEDRFGKVSEEMLIYMYEEWFESMKQAKGIEKVNQNNKYIEIVFDENTTNTIKADELFIKAYQVSKNFKLAYSFKRLRLMLNLNNLDKHWIYYIVKLLNNM